jgi:periplasmic protein CpxP/Spy
MKRQIIALVAGAALLASPFMTNMATAQKGEGGPRGPQIEQLAKKLNLTDAQKSQLEGIKSRTQAKIRAVLTPDQQAKFDAARAEHQKHREAMKANGGKRPEGEKGEHKGPHGMLRSLNLTDSQKAQMKEIHAAAKAEMDGVLTPSQKTQLEQLKQQRQGRRGLRRPG